MRVFNDIGRGLAIRLDRLSLGWLRQLGKTDLPSASDVVVLRLLIAACLVCLAVLTTLSGMLLGPALALPVAAALIIATLLFFSAAMLWLLRPREIEPVASDAADLVFEACPGLILVCDGNGMILKSGGRDRTLLPAARRDPRGLSIAELVHVSDRIAVAQALDALRQGQASAKVEARVEHGLDPEGGRQFIAVRLELVAATGDEALQNVLVQIVDVSEEMQLREDIVERTSEALSAHEAKSRFLASMSHELRTPLNAILGFSEVMAQEVLGPMQNATYKEYAGDIHRSGQHLLNLINEILDLSRIEAGRYELSEEALSLLEVAEDCIGMVQLRARAKNITIHQQFEPNLPQVWADEKSIRQVILNLLSNAVKFTSQGGEVTVKVGWTAGGGQYVAIKDNGPGIAEEEIPIVLSAFGQGSIAIKSAEQGTGLGLPIVQAILAKHDGQFILRSKLREGTEAIAILPKTRVLQSVAAVADAKSVEPRRRSFA